MFWYKTWLFKCSAEKHINIWQFWTFIFSVMVLGWLTMRTFFQLHYLDKQYIDTERLVTSSTSIPITASDMNNHFKETKSVMMVQLSQGCGMSHTLNARIVKTILKSKRMETIMNLNSSISCFPFSFWSLLKCLLWEWRCLPAMKCMYLWCGFSFLVPWNEQCPGCQCDQYDPHLVLLCGAFHPTWCCSGFCPTEFLFNFILMVSWNMD